jgi:hypothetical protein
VALSAIATSAWAADPIGDKIDGIEARLDEQDRRLDEQDHLLRQQARMLEEQRAELRTLQASRDQMLGEIRAGRAMMAAQDPALNAAAAAPEQTGVGPTAGAPIRLAQAPGESGDSQAPGAAPLPVGPVGEKPPEPVVSEADTAALPDRAGVLTPPGTFIIEPSLEYVRSSANRLVFRGIEIVPGFQIGVIEANEADRDTLVGNIGGRYGVTNRLEVEARVGYVFRKDRITDVQQRDEAITRQRDLEGQDIGDVELAARYQINSGGNGWPIFVANGRVKIPTGTGPFDVPFDSFGVARELATGSGFLGVELGATMLYPTDPGVIFGGLSYIYNVKDDIDKVIGDVLIGEVDPGDGIGLNMGYGLSLNPRFSVSFGYSHTYIFPTKTQFGPTEQSSDELQVGTFLAGWSFRVSPRVSISSNFEFGVTDDAPDMRFILRVPYRF